MKRILVVGGTSAIGGEVGRRFAAVGSSIVLAGRDPAKLDAVAADLRVRGAAGVSTCVFDARDLDGVETMWHAAVDAFDGLDGVLVAHGSLPDHAVAAHHVATTMEALTVNLASAVAVLTLAADHFEREGRGCIAAISSVAGDRGRQSNYIYGAAKAGLNAFLEGLRNRLHPAGVAVVTIKPGFVDTPMTAHLPKNALFASPETVGAAVYRAMRRRRDTVYAPWYWRWIMLAIRHLPGPVFKRLKL